MPAAPQTLFDTAGHGTISQEEFVGVLEARRITTGMQKAKRIGKAVKAKHRGHAKVFDQVAAEEGWEAVNKRRSGANS